jgi:hypothetical protein
VARELAQRFCASTDQLELHGGGGGQGGPEQESLGERSALTEQAAQALLDAQAEIEAQTVD